MEKYSVLMTVYTNDNPGYFSLALDSMLDQTCPPDEVVIVKDGPIGDELQEIIDERIAKGFPVVQYRLEKNAGLGAALNTGVEIARNELIARMDSDDYSCPGRCERQLAEFAKNPGLDIVGCSVLEFSGSIDNIVGERRVPLTNEEIYKFSKKRDPFNHPTVMYRKSAVLAAGGYSDYRKNQDTDLWIKMLRNNAVCMNIEEPLFRFRFDENTYKKRRSWTNTKTLISIRYKAWKTGFNTFGEFLSVAAAQLCVFILPTGFQKFVYRKILRR